MAEARKHAVRSSDPLLTDLYQLTMLQAYWRSSMTETAVFEFFVRRLPRQRNFLIAAGLEQVLDYLENLHFSAAEIDWLRSTGRLRKASCRPLSLWGRLGYMQMLCVSLPIVSTPCANARNVRPRHCYTTDWFRVGQS